MNPWPMPPRMACAFPVEGTSLLSITYTKEGKLIRSPSFEYLIVYQAVSPTPRRFKNRLEALLIILNGPGFVNSGILHIFVI